MEVRLCSVQTMRVVHYCGIFAYRTRHTQCVACLFLHVALCQIFAYRTRHTDRGFNKYRRPTKHVGYFPHLGRLLFYRKKEQLD